MAKRVSTRKIKKHRLYGYGEAGDALGVTSHTVRSWRPLGLEVMAATIPHYILGAELIRYTEDQQAKRSVKMSLDQMFASSLKRRAIRFGRWSITFQAVTQDRLAQQADQ
jgi:hypothetical protein